MMLQPKRNCRLILLSTLVIIGLFLVLQSVLRASLTITQNEIEYEKNFTDRQRKAEIDSIILPQINENEAPYKSNQLDDSRDEKELQPIATTASPTPTRTQLLKEILKCKDRTLAMEKLQYGSYWLVRNFIRGTISTTVGCAESITYTTHGDYTFFDSLAMVALRWLAPISFAIFAPGHDLNATMDSIQYVRNCLPESDLILKYVTFHVYFPALHMPSHIPLTEKDALAWPYDCQVETPPYMDVNRTEMYKTGANLTYPINVGRNIARRAVNTYFIFACDIELFPTMGLASQFLDLVAKNHTLIVGGNKLRVFPLPVFEINQNATIPETKKELAAMIRTKMAIPFHSKICKSCHLVPQQAKWMNATTAGNALTITAVGKRESAFRYWEPFYISDNKEPMFDERVTWEGQSNKRIQGYAMCLLGYEYHVLHPAFLVHTPGIKYYDKNSPRLKYVKVTNKLIRTTIQPEYTILYGKNTNCRT